MRLVQFDYIYYEQEEEQILKQSITNKELEILRIQFLIQTTIINFPQYKVGLDNQLMLNRK